MIQRRGAARFQALREREARSELSPAERAELDALVAAIDANEAATLTSAAQRLCAEAMENASLEAKARALLRIVEEEKRLLTGARATLKRLRQRSTALAEDYLRVMGREFCPLTERSDARG